jgi:uncharacterized protein YijF (DUF1287 family)
MIALLLLATMAGALPDRGIFPELLARVSFEAPRHVDPAHAWLRVDHKNKLVTLYDGDDPVALYALGAPEIPSNLHEVAGAPPRSEDRDGDGIVDRLDVLVGAKKLLYNGARYIERYVSIAYPGGDVPRSEGVCSDTVIRALRNAGLDLQREVHEDILRAPAAYPMVEKVDASINHRRVRTLLPWFLRHWQTLPKGTKYQPGDVVFFDTFPQREGPDHLGVVSDTLAKSGMPMVINNWTDGATDAEMDLLSWVPVTHHFRWPAPKARVEVAGGKPHSR